MNQARSATVVIAALVLSIGALIAAVLMSAAVFRIWRIAHELRGSALESQEELPQRIGIAVYNVSLCALLNNTIEPRKWGLVVYNIGNKRLKVDHIAIERGGARVREWSNEYELLPNQYKYIGLEGICNREECAELRVHVHTADGVYGVGGYWLPDPYVLTHVREGRCHEPGEES